MVSHQVVVWKIMERDKWKLEDWFWKISVSLVVRIYHPLKQAQSPQLFSWSKRTWTWLLPRGFSGKPYQHNFPGSCIRPPFCQRAWHQRPRSTSPNSDDVGPTPFKLEDDLCNSYNFLVTGNNNWKEKKKQRWDAIIQRKSYQKTISEKEYQIKGGR